MLSPHFLWCFLCLFGVVFVCDASNQPGNVEVIVSDESGLRLSPLSHSLSWEKNAPPPQQNYLSINIDKRYQTIHGFGGSFLRSGALTLNTLPEEKQEDVLESLFDVEKGAGFSVGKVPIGACDYCPLTSSSNETRWWSYREKPYHPFSLGPDLEEEGGTVPYVSRAAKYINKNNNKNTLWLQSTIDYPPGWMLEGDLPGATVNPRFYEELAQYYLDFTQQFETGSGVPIHYLSLFNEPIESYTNMTVSQIASLLVDHVSPLFQKHAPHVGLTYASPPSRRSTIKKTPRVMAIPGVSEATSALFYHGYDCAPWICSQDEEEKEENIFNITCPELRDSSALIEGLHEMFPSYPLWMSEVCYAQEYGSYLGPEGGCPALPFDNFEDSIQWGKMIVSDMRSHASAWIYWNMILDQNGGPHMTNPEHNDPEIDIQQPLVIVNTETGEVLYTGVYYALAHFGKYVKRGGERVRVEGDVSVNVHFVGFFDEGEGRVVVQLVNDSEEKNSVVLEFGGFVSEEVELSPISITTLRFFVQ